jgi:hypothetical protein
VEDPNADAVIVDYDDIGWLYVRYMAELLPARPLTLMLYRDVSRLQVTPEAERKVYFWSPGLERDGGVSRLICERWPGSALYTLTDRAGMFQALAASPAGDVWRPRLPPERWRVAKCGEG